MNNVLLEPLPTEWEGYEVNTDFRIGIQVFQASYDTELLDFERTQTILYLLFADEDDSVRDFPREPERQQECIAWFLNGWSHDNPTKGGEKRRLIDFDVDQWRIYADFLHFYRIDLNRVPEMHWWAFMALLWNLPYRESSFLQVLDIRQKKITTGMAKEQREALQSAKRTYALEQPKQERKLTKEEEEKIDAFDRMMAEAKRKRQNRG